MKKNYIYVVSDGFTSKYFYKRDDAKEFLKKENQKWKEFYDSDTYGPFESKYRSPISFKLAKVSIK